MGRYKSRYGCGLCGRVVTPKAIKTKLTWVKCTCCGAKIHLKWCKNGRLKKVTSEQENKKKK